MEKAKSKPQQHRASSFVPVSSALAGAARRTTTTHLLSRPKRLSRSSREVWPRHRLLRTSWSRNMWKRFLAGWKGYLHTDGYQGYHILPDVTVVGCWAHVRRKFDEALKILPAEQRAGSSAERGLGYCNRLFELERELSGLPPEEIRTKRLEHSLPIAEEFFAWAKTFDNQPKCALKTAANYLVGQWPYLKNLFLDGRLELSNNRAERSIKPFVIGRKNWLFSNTQKGARASSVIYSIIETAKENGLKPFAYLKLLFETMPNCTTGQIGELLPWSPAVQEKCKVGGI